MYKRKNIALLFLFCLILLSGCVNQIGDVSKEEETKESVPLVIHIRSNDGTELTYPILLYAFDETGVCTANKRLTAATEDARMLLPAGSYTLVALSGANGYSLPATPKLTDLITLSEGVPSSQVLWTGSGTVQVAGRENSVNLTLTSAVSRINLSLTDIPEGVVSVSVTMGSLYQGMSLSGSYQGYANVTIPLTKSRGDVRTDDVSDNQAKTTWSAPTLYVFPGMVSSRLSLTITLTHHDGTIVTNAYTADRNLLPNTPYRLEGNYAEGFGVNSNLSWSQWNEEQIIMFSFGGKNNGNDSSNDGGTVATLPATGEVWNGHFVALSTPDEANRSAILRLFSLKEWTDVSAAVEGSADPIAAASYAASYTEKGTDSSIGGWRIPTKEEAKAIRSVIGGTEELLAKSNATLFSLGGTPISIGEEKKGVTIRYLCQNAASSINFFGTGGVTGCGSKRTYRLRLVTDVRVTVE